MTYKNNKILLVIFTLILFILSSSVLGIENFQAASVKDIDVCACADKIIPVKIQNTGYLKQNTLTINGETTKEVSLVDISSKYSISTHGSAAEFFTIDESSFRLSSREEYMVYGFIKAPCDKEGKYDLFIDIESDSGLKKRVSSEVTIEKCPNVALLTYDNNNTLDPCGSTEYKFIIKNTGEFNEVYDLNINRLRSSVTFSENPVKIASKDSKAVFMKISPSCRMLSDKRLTLGVHAQNSKFYSELPFYLNVNQTYYDYDIMLDESEYTFCQGSQVIVPAEIINHADNENIVDLRIKGKNKFAELSNSKVALESSGSYPLNITFDVPNDEKGIFNFTLYSRSKVQNIRKELDLSANVITCHGAMFYAEDIVVNYSMQQFPVEIIHLGERTQTYKLDMISPSWLKLSKGEITLEPGEVRQINLISEPNESVQRGNYAVKLIASLDSDESISYSNKMEVFISESGTKTYLDKIIYSKLGIFSVLMLIDIILLIGGVFLLVTLFRRKKDPKQKTLKEVMSPAKKTKKKKSKGKKKRSGKNIFLIAAVAAIILLILGASGFFLYKHFRSTSGIALNETNATIMDETLDFDLNETPELELNETIELNETSDQDQTTDVNQTETELNQTEEPEAVLNESIVNESTNETKISLLTKLKDKCTDVKGWMGEASISTKDFFHSVFLFCFSYKWQIISAMIFIAAIILIIYFLRKEKFEDIQTPITDESFEQKSEPESLKEKECKKKKCSKLICGGAVLIALLLLLAGVYYYGENGFGKFWNKEEVDNLSIEDNENYITDIDALNNVTKDYGENGYPEVILDDIPVVEDETPEEEELESAEEIIEAEVTEEIIMPEYSISEEEIRELVGPVIRWDMNTNFTIDLNEIFADPDGDILKFSITSIKNISYELDEDVGFLTLLPDENWTGISYVWLTADDGNGGITTSEKIYLVVTKPKQITGKEKLMNDIKSVGYTIKDFASDYSYYIIMGFIILVVLILITKYNKYLIKFLDDDEGQKKKTNGSSKKPAKKKKSKKK